MIKLYLPVIAAMVVFATCHYAIFCFGTCEGKRDKRFLHIAFALSFPSIILMLTTLELSRSVQ